MPVRRHPIRAFAANAEGASAVEFSLVSMPFILILLMILQMGMYYMAQSSLDSGLLAEADTLVNSFNSGTVPTAPTAAALKTAVVSKSGGLIRNNSSLSVEIRQFNTLTAASVAVGNAVDLGAAGSLLALRAQAQVPMLVPGLGSLAYVRSSALLRRQDK